MELLHSKTNQIRMEKPYAFVETEDIDNHVKREWAEGMHEEGDYYEGEVNEKRWADGKQERNIIIYERDLFSFFGKTVRIDEMQTYENYDNFCEFMKEK